MNAEEEIQLANEHGYSAVKDQRRGYNWCKFFAEREDGSVRWVWKFHRGGSRPMWQTSNLANGYYQDHQPCTTLKEAFERPL